MKLKSFFLTVLAASMALVSCNNEDAAEMPQDNQLKSVKVTLPNLQMAAQRAVGNGIANDTKALLKDYKIFFLDAQGNVVPVPNVNSLTTPTEVAETGGEEQETYFSSATDYTSASATFHFLPSKVSQVVVVGNLGVEDNYDFGTLAEIKAATQNVQNDGSLGNPYYPMFGIDTDITDEAADHANPAHTNVFQATVNVKPAVARLEILGFGYSIDPAATGPAYDKIRISKIGLKNYYTQYQFNGTNDAVNATAVGDVVNPTVTEENAFQVIAALDANWSDVLPAGGASPLALDVVSGTIDHPCKYADGQAFTPVDNPWTAAEGNTRLENIITYTLVSGTTLPELLIDLTGQKGTEGVVPHYLYVNSFGLTQVEAGKIYRTVIDFQDTDLLDPQKCIELSVTVEDWVVEVVNPTFGN